MLREAVIAGTLAVAGSIILGVSLGWYILTPAGTPMPPMPISHLSAPF